MKTFPSLYIALFVALSCSHEQPSEEGNTMPSQQETELEKDASIAALHAYADSLISEAIYPKENWATYAVLDSLCHSQKRVRQFYFPASIAILHNANASIAEDLGEPMYNYIYAHPIEFAENASKWDNSWEGNMMRIGEDIAHHFDRDGSPEKSYDRLKRRILLHPEFNSSDKEIVQNLKHLLTLISVHLNIPVDLSTLETRTDTEFKPLTEVLTADLNGDGSPEKISFLREGESAGFQIVDGKTGMLTLIGFNRDFENFLTNYDWVEDWRLILPQTTTEHTLVNGDISPVEFQLEQVSIKIRKTSEVSSSGIITYKNGKYYWVHQGC